MIDETASQHIQRLKLATTEKLQRKDLGNWVTKNTFLNGKPFSTAGHEYQTKIMEDDAPEIVIKRSAQIGISEMSLRMTLGLVSIMPNFSAIYTMPTATLAGVYTKTRLDSIIQGSPFLKDAVRGDLDSAEVKQLGLNNFMYMRGAAVGNAAISVSTDLLVHDELSFSDPAVPRASSSFHILGQLRIPANVTDDSALSWPVAMRAELRAQIVEVAVTMGLCSSSFGVFSRSAAMTHP